MSLLPIAYYIYSYINIYSQWISLSDYNVLSFNFKRHRRFSNIKFQRVIRFHQNSLNSSSLTVFARVFRLRWIAYELSEGASLDSLPTCLSTMNPPRAPVFQDFLKRERERETRKRNSGMISAFFFFKQRKFCSQKQFTTLTRLIHYAVSPVVY